MTQQFVRVPNSFEEEGIRRQEAVLFMNLDDKTKKEIADRRYKHSCEICASRGNRNCDYCKIPGAHANVIDTIDRGIMRNMTTINKTNRIPEKKDKAARILEVLRTTAAEYNGMSIGMSVLFERLQDAGLLEEG